MHLAQKKCRFGKLTVAARFLGWYRKKKGWLSLGNRTLGASNAEEELVDISTWKFGLAAPTEAAMQHVPGPNGLERSVADDIR
jgi:hypothetical protein